MKFVLESTRVHGVSFWMVIEGIQDSLSGILRIGKNYRSGFLEKKEHLVPDSRLCRQNYGSQPRSTSMPSNICGASPPHINRIRGFQYYPLP